MADWKSKAIAGSSVAGDMSDWRRKAIEASQIQRDIFADGPAEADIDFSRDAPALIRMEVGALDKPEDRLKALQKTYPDAKPYGDSNFIYTDPSDGKVRLYNNESWFPSLGDFASIAPEIGESIGGAGGAIVGGIGGGAAGSVLPILGTGAGAVSGGIAGAGTGSVAGREATQRGLNYLFGNDDTRTGGEQFVDGLQTFALGAAGEGVGRALGAGVKAGKNAWTRHVIGDVDSTAQAAERAADWRAINAEPTAGMITGNQKTSLLEHALIPTRSGSEIDRRVNDAFTKQTDEFGRIVSGLSDRPLSVAEAGEALRAQAQAAKDAGFARSEQLYDAVADKVTAPAVLDSTSSFLKGLTEARAGYGEFDNLTRGSQADSIIKQATAIVTDAQKGMSFDQLKAARTYIGQTAADTDDKVLKSHLNGLYASLTSDMEKTAAASGPEGLQAFKKANNAFRRLVDDEKGFGKGSTASTLLDKNTDDLLNWSLSGAKNGGNRIAQVRRTIQRSEGGQEAWNQVISGMTDRLGRNSADEFDPGTFMRNWNKMSDEAKGALFNGTSNQQYRQDLDRLARIADNYTKYRKSANHSNTENHRAVKNSLNPFSTENAVFSFFGLATTANPITGLAAGLGKAVATRVAAQLSQGSRARLLTNPEVVNWMANLPKAEMQKGGIKDHFQKLVDLRKKTSDQGLASAINDYLKDLHYEEE